MEEKAGAGRSRWRLWHRGAAHAAGLARSVAERGIREGIGETRAVVTGGNAWGREHA